MNQKCNHMQLHDLYKCCPILFVFFFFFLLLLLWLLLLLLLLSSLPAFRLLLAKRGREKRDRGEEGGAHGPFLFASPDAQIQGYSKFSWLFKPRTPPPPEIYKGFIAGLIKGNQSIKLVDQHGQQLSAMEYLHDRS